MPEVFHHLWVWGAPGHEPPAGSLFEMENCLWVLEALFWPDPLDAVVEVDHHQPESWVWAVEAWLALQSPLWALGVAVPCLWVGEGEAGQPLSITPSSG